MGDIMHEVKLMSRGSTETELDVASMFVLLELTTRGTPTSSVHRPSIVLSLQAAGALGRKKSPVKAVTMWLLMCVQRACDRPAPPHVSIESGPACPPAPGRMPDMARRQPSRRR